MQVVLLAKLAELAKEAEDDLLVRAALERDTLALVVEAQAEEKGDGNTLAVLTAARTRLDDTPDDWGGVERGRLDEDVALGELECGEPGGGLRAPDVVMSGRAVRTAVDESDRCGSESRLRERCRRDGLHSRKGLCFLCKR